MIRSTCIALQLAVLALSGLGVSALAVPFSPEGLVNVPSRFQAGLYIFVKMPVDGIAYLNVLRVLVWVPAITAAIAVATGRGRFFRLLRRAGAVANLAALGYLYTMFPRLLSPDRVPVILSITFLLFVGNAVLLSLMDQQKKEPVNRNYAAFLLLVLGSGAIAIHLHAVFQQPVSPLAQAVMGCCSVGLSLSFYGLVKAMRGAGAQKKGGLLFLLPPFCVFVAFMLVSPPLALPVGAGLLLFIALLLP